MLTALFAERCHKSASLMFFALTGNLFYLHSIPVCTSFVGVSTGSKGYTYHELTGFLAVSNSYMETWRFFHLWHFLYFSRTFHVFKPWTLTPLGVYWSAPYKPGFPTSMFWECAVGNVMAPSIYVLHINASIMIFLDFFRPSGIRTIMWEVIF